MNMSIALTLDGLLRALRWKGHELAEQIEFRRPEQPRNADQMKEVRDDRSLR